MSSFRSIVDRIKDSLFLLPAGLILGFAVLATIALWLDDVLSGADSAWLVSTTVDSARSILSTVATATVTVAAIVFSMTAVVVQLATSQFSPRVTQGFLRNRFQQFTIGITVGTFVYSLLILTSVRGSEEGTPPTHNVSVSIAVVLGVVSMLMIVSFIDRIMRSMRIDTVVRQLADQVERSIARMGTPGVHDESAVTLPDTSTSTLVPIATSGWVESIDVATLLAALPSGGSVRVELKVGDFMADGEPLATVWPEVDEAAVSQIRAGVSISRVRTITNDPAYGIRQMVDIALRALSPALNDATTGADVVHHLSGAVRSVLLRDLPARVRVGDDNRRVFLPRSLTHSDYVHAAFREIRINAINQPHVLRALLETLSSLIGIVERAGFDGRTSALKVEADATLDVVASSAMTDHDKEALVSFARSVGLIGDADHEPDNPAG